MEIKVGGIYRTRYGGKAKIVHYKESANKYPYVVILYLKKDEWIGCYTPDGRYNAAYETEHDLVAEWTEREFDE
jgi:hypothetical protein